MRLRELRSTSRQLAFLLMAEVQGLRRERPEVGIHPATLDRLICCLSCHERPALDRLRCCLDCQRCRRRNERAGDR